MEKKPNRKGQEGMTLGEVMVAIFVSVLLFGAMASAYGVVRGSIGASQHRVQALNVARGEIERLRGVAFNNIAPSVQNNVPFSAGDDAVFGTADDLTGTLTVLVQDVLDLDGDDDGNDANDDVDEQWLDIDGDGNEDQTARPIRVIFTWREHYMGQDRNLSVALDTVIAA